MKNINNSNKKKSLAKSILGVIFLLSILGLTSLIWNIGSAIFASKNSVEEINGSKFIKSDESISKKRAIKLSEELTERISRNSTLPETSSYRTTWFQETQASNQKFIDDLLEQLAAELGSSETLGILRTIKENREALKQANELSQSKDKTIANESKEKVRNLKMEIQILTSKLQESYEKDGFELTQAQINSLIESPHGEETASIINCFQNIKAICFVMENRLRNHPSQEMARKYYGAYHAMLLALDKMQNNTISKINLVHIPATEDVEYGARAAAITANELLNKTEHVKNLSPNQQQALRFNIESCQKTEQKAQETKYKLIESAESLQKSNAKLQYSITTAENSHTTMLLHTEIERIGKEHLADLEKLQKMTLPEIVAADFSNPKDPWLSPPNIRELK